MVKLLASIFVCCLFCMRDAVCEKYFPNMRTEVGEWDGANELTMNLFAAIIILMVVVSISKTVHPITNFFIYFIFCLSAFDVVDRIARHYTFDGFDLIFVIPISAIISASIYAYVYRNGEKTID